MPHPLRLRLRLKAGRKLVLGPGRLQMLEGIQSTGSISGAARAMGMSYRRAWTLVDDINRCFQTPLVESVAGGQRGGGAHLTALGEEVLGTYARLLDKADAAVAEETRHLERLIAEDVDAPEANAPQS